MWATMGTVYLKVEESPKFGQQPKRSENIKFKETCVSYEIGSLQLKLRDSQAWGIRVRPYSVALNSLINML